MKRKLIAIIVIILIAGLAAIIFARKTTPEPPGTGLNQTIGH